MLPIISISSVSERDVDLLLLEEFVSSAQFSQWFLRKAFGEVHPRRQPNLSLLRPNDWLRLAIRSSAGAGNPKGSLSISVVAARESVRIDPRHFLDAIGEVIRVVASLSPGTAFLPRKRRLDGKAYGSL
jgi:hypothetical protein